MIRRFFLIVTLAGVLLIPHFASADQQCKDLAIAAIDDVINSLKSEPNQFYLQVNVIGTKVVSTGSGTGMNISVQGGGEGSTTTGLISSASSGQQIEIVKSEANEAIRKKTEEAVKILNEIKSDLKKKYIDKPTITDKLKEWSKTYVPPAIKAVIEGLIKKILKL